MPLDIGAEIAGPSGGADRAKRERLTAAADPALRKRWSQEPVLGGADITEMPLVDRHLRLFEIFEPWNDHGLSDAILLDCIDSVDTAAIFAVTHRRPLSVTTMPLWVLRQERDANIKHVVSVMPGVSRRVRRRLDQMIEGARLPGDPGYAEATQVADELRLLQDGATRAKSASELMAAWISVSRYAHWLVYEASDVPVSNGLILQRSPLLRAVMLALARTRRRPNRMHEKPLCFQICRTFKMISIRGAYHTRKITDRDLPDGALHEKYGPLIDIGNAVSALYGLTPLAHGKSGLLLDCWAEFNRASHRA